MARILMVLYPDPVNGYPPKKAWISGWLPPVASDRPAAPAGTVRCSPAFTDPHRLPAELEKELDVTFHPDMQSLVKAVDVVSIHSPLYAGTHGMFDEKLLNSMRCGAYIVNCARAEETVPDAIVAALDSGQLAGYAGDVWHPRPPAADHPWRTMAHNAMTPHVSGSTLFAQARYAPAPGKFSKTGSPTGPSARSI